MHRLAEPCARGRKTKRTAGRRPPTTAAVALWGLMLTPLQAANLITVDYAGDRPLNLAQGEAPRSDCSLREAINNADNRSRLTTNACAAGTGDDIIEFAPAIAEVRLDTGQFDPLSIHSNARLIIRGRSYDEKITINGRSSGGILDIDNTDAYVEMENIQFVGGNREGAGGALLQRGGTVVLRGCRFDVNLAHFGGAIAVTESDTTLIIYDCVFWANAAVGLPGDFTGWGGAIWFAGGYAEIKRTSFAENYAKLEGGAIDCDSSGTMNIAGGDIAANDNDGGHNSYFIGNSTLLTNVDLAGVAGGGAIGSRCRLIVDSTLFAQNTTEGKGGAVKIDSGSVGAYFHRVSFRKNRAIAIGGVGGFGGAAAVEGKAIFNRVSASNNNADYGGAFLFRGMTGSRDATVENATLLENRALRGSGAAIYFTGPFQYNNVRILNATLDDNDGGADGNTLFFDANLNGAVAFGNDILQTKKGSHVCGGTVNSSTLSAIEGSNIQFDLYVADSCNNGIVGQVIKTFDAKFITRGVTSPQFPYLRYSSIGVFSPANHQPGPNAPLCDLTGFAVPYTWPALTVGSDQMGKRRDQYACSMGAVQPSPYLVF